MRLPRPLPRRRRTQERRRAPRPMTHVSTSVIVAIDGASASISALRHAKRFAEARKLRLRAVSVWSTVNTSTPFLPAGLPTEDATGLLAEVSREVFGDDLPDWYEQKAVKGSTVRALLRASRTAALLVLGSRGLGGFTGLLLGSVSAQCAAHANCPVMIIHEQNDAASLPADAPIVVGDDGSAGSNAALEWALQAAETFVAPVQIVRSWTIDRLPLRYEELGFNPSSEDVNTRVLHDLVTDTQNRIERHPTVRVTREAVMAHPVAELISRSQHARLLVVGSRGRGGFARLRLGSVGAESASYSHCPVVVVPPRANQNPNR
ncbi:hypothetical protein B7R22_02070 [Subtercola boreus]|uniref:UspA domain-containing protein n=1 Tax=Subtercola boreus TaxID=120213 RepID=A0A3E0W656_9MICO|nr:hypothetical protein B7R22_02070 [Subtercola boreus]